MTQTSRDLILNSVVNLLTAKGYNAFSFADISEDVGLAKPSIHHHFATKEDLVVEVLTQYRKQILEGLQLLNAKKSNPLERLKAYVSYWQECIESGDRPFCICVLLAAEKPSLPKAVQKQVKMHFEELGAWLTSAIDEGKKSGLIHSKNSAKHEADLFRAQVHGAMLAARALDDAQVFSATTRTLISQFQK